MTEIHDAALFLAHACALEEDAANRFADLSEAMKTYGNQEVAAFFGQMAKFSRMHLAEARERSGFRKIPDLAPEDFQWLDGDSPEAASMEGSHYLMTVEYALELALESEKRGQAFYAEVAKTTTDSEVRMMAEEFAAEEAEHVAQLEVWAKRYPALQG
ncbi:ferritin family protein [Azospirillum oryzae]|uniref:Ferritin family protein n=1 Tax=Azospirillum oryzae TaxID=286727 RepID=A0A6N1AIQ2_9PROT|nr:ferritin family protein [Azospirillum oryzae]KAA0589338.1 ferritin family protein [Azospirillum oryzae]QKS51179.1 ferritin family protein [Azospirillum oryzae]GLR83086.1 rubrerythrin [Azospirillum oryzae]